MTIFASEASHCDAENEALYRRVKAAQEGMKNLRMTLTRAHNTLANKLAADREKLARLEPGGSPARPWTVESASLVEPRATGLPCLRCDSPVRAASHDAEDFDGTPLRVVGTECKRCGARRTLYFAIQPPLPN